MALIILPLITLKVLFTPGLADFGLDGGFYFQIARNVLRGEGLVTSVSLYHQALNPLPQSSSMIYPAWPFLLGMTGKLIGLVPAALLLPKIFYLLDLILLYLLTMSVCRSMGTDGVLSGMPVDAGHLMVLLFGTNQVFFSATSRPYTEGLAFAFLFASLVAFHKAEQYLKWKWSVAAGLLAGLAFLTRTQMICVVAGIGLVSLMISFKERRLSRRLIGFAIPAAILVGSWYFLIYAAPMERADIPYFDMWVETNTMGEWLAERFEGVKVSFHPFSPLSYVHLYGPASYLPVVSLLAIVYRVSRRREAWFASGSTMIAVLTSGLAFFATLNLYHEKFFVPWLFGWRHGLPLLLLIIPSTIYLLSENWPRPFRLLVVLLIVWSSALGLRSIAMDAARPQRWMPSPAEVEMLRWFDENHEGRPTILTTHAQTLAVFTDANIHWMVCSEAPKRTRQLIDSLPIDYVVVYRNEIDCRYQRGLGDALELVEDFGKQQLFLLRPK